MHRKLVNHYNNISFSQLFPLCLCFYKNVPSRIPSFYYEIMPNCCKTITHNKCIFINPHRLLHLLQFYHSPHHLMLSSLTTNSFYTKISPYVKAFLKKDCEKHDRNNVGIRVILLYPHFFLTIPFFRLFSHIRFHNLFAGLVLSCACPASKTPLFTTSHITQT